MMRTDIQLTPGFAAGLGLGLALAGVTVLTVGATRRMRSRRMISRAQEHVPVIDGVYALEPPALDARPAEEANAAEIPRLESEAPDVAPTSQRW